MSSIFLEIEFVFSILTLLYGATHLNVLLLFLKMICKLLLLEETPLLFFNSSISSLSLMIDPPSADKFQSS